MNNRETYLNYILEGSVQSRTRDGETYAVNVFALKENLQPVYIFKEQTFISGTAIIMIFRDRRTNPIPFLESRTFSKARARLILKKYEEGKAFEEEIMTYSKSSIDDEQSDSIIQQKILESLLVIRKSQPQSFKKFCLEIDGLSYLLGISKEKLIFNASLLLEEKYILMNQEYDSKLEKGGFHITRKGSSHLSEIIATGSHQKGEKEKSKILFVSADPIDVSHLRIQREIRGIREELSMSEMSDMFIFEECLATRPSDLSRALLKKPRPRFLHFSGHGSGRGAICLEDDSGTIHPISIKDLSALLKPIAKDLRCVILNACYSRKQADGMLDAVSYIVGMNNQISDEAAIAFSVGFYQAIFSEEDVKTAHALGCAQVQMKNPVESHIPDLIASSTRFVAQIDDVSIYEGDILVEKGEVDIFLFKAGYRFWVRNWVCLHEYGYDETDVKRLSTADINKIPLDKYEIHTKQQISKILKEGHPENWS